MDTHLPEPALCDRDPENAFLTAHMYKEVYHALIAIHGSDAKVHEYLHTEKTLPISYSSGVPITFGKSVYSKMVTCLFEHVQDKDHSIAEKSHRALQTLGEI